MIEEQQNTNFKEYCEQEGISHDDVINKEIEQEHEECKKCRQENYRVEFETPKAEMQQLISEKMDNPNYFPMTVKFSLEAIKFIDMTEFNNKTYLPCEFEEAKKKYVQEKLAEELYKTLKELQVHIEGKEYCPISLNTGANPFNKLDYLMKGLRAAAKKILIP